MTYEFYENEAEYVSKEEISAEARALIAKRLGHVTVVMS